MLAVELISDEQGTPERDPPQANTIMIIIISSPNMESFFWVFAEQPWDQKDQLKQSV